MFRSHWTIIREHVDPSQSYHLPLIFTLHFGAAEACLYEVLGYVCIPLLMCILCCCAWEVGLVVCCADHKGEVQPRTSHESLDGE